MAPVIYGLLFIGSISILVWWLINHLRLRRIIDRLPGPRSYPLIGNAHQYKSDPNDFFAQAGGVCMMFQKPRLHRVWLLLEPFVIVYGAEEAEVILGNGRKRLAFLDLLIDMAEKNQLTIQDIRDEVNTFMFESHDTTATGMNWALHLLGCNPEIQVKVHQELDAVFGDDPRDVDFDDLRNPSPVTPPPPSPPPPSPVTPPPPAPLLHRQ